MAATDHLYKLGRLTNLPDDPVTVTNFDPRHASETEWRHGNFYERTTIGDKAVLIIGAASGHRELLSRMLTLWDGPFGVLYVLAVPRVGEPGRYQSDSPVPQMAAEAVFTHFGEFLDRDARHQLWFLPMDEPGSPIVWDQRNRIFGYGSAMDAYERLCIEAGITPGIIELPYGLSRHYHAEFDPDEERLIAGDKLAWEWIRTPLRDGDDD